MMNLGNLGSLFAKQAPQMSGNTPQFQGQMPQFSGISQAPQFNPLQSMQNPLQAQTQGGQNPYMAPGDMNPVQPMTGGDPFSQINQGTMIQNAIARMGQTGPQPSYEQLLGQVRPIGPLGQIGPRGSALQPFQPPQAAGGRQGGGAQYNARGVPQFGSFFSMSGAPEDKQWTPYKQGSPAYKRYVQDARDAEQALQGG